LAVMMVGRGWVIAGCWWQRVDGDDRGLVKVMVVAVVVVSGAVMMVMAHSNKKNEQANKQ
jgi:hypothetical protein